MAMALLYMDFVNYWVGNPTGPQRLPELESPQTSFSQVGRDKPGPLDAHSPAEQVQYKEKRSRKSEGSRAWNPNTHGVKKNDQEMIKNDQESNLEDGGEYDAFENEEYFENRPSTSNQSNTQLFQQKKRVSAKRTSSCKTNKTGKTFESSTLESESSESISLAALLRKIRKTKKERDQSTQTENSLRETNVLRIQSDSDSEERTRTVLQPRVTDLQREKKPSTRTLSSPPHSSTSETDEDEHVPEPEQAQQNHKCQFCTYVGKTKNALRQHRFNHHGRVKPLLECEEEDCPFITLKKYKLKLHKQRHRDPDYIYITLRTATAKVNGSAKKVFVLFPTGQDPFKIKEVLTSCLLF